MCTTGARLTTIRYFRSIVFLAAATLALSTACTEPAPSTESVAPRKPSVPKAESATQSIHRAVSGRIYVPTYSHIYTSSGTAKDLAVTLSIRNISVEHELFLESVRYYDTAGKLIEEYISGTEVRLGPLETVEYFVSTNDQRGGSGANFLVTWHSRVPLVDPFVEAVMVRDDQGTRSFAFSSRGVLVPNSAAPPSQASALEARPATKSKAKDKAEPSGATP